MKFKEELYTLSVEAAQNGALLRNGKEVWEAMKEPLRKLAKETGECGCNVFFFDVPNVVILQLSKLIADDGLEFFDLNSSEEAGHPGGNFEQIGLLTWNRAVYLTKYPFKVSRYSLLVSMDVEGIHVEYVDAGPEASLF